MATVQQVQAYNQQHVNWSKFFSVVETLGTTMNAQKDRFDKSDIIEMALEAYSGGNITYVNANGIDHNLVNLANALGTATTQEMKFCGGVFYKERVTRRARGGVVAVKQVVAVNRPVTLKLLNSNGSNGHTDIPPNYAQFLLVVDNYSAFVALVDDIRPYEHVGGDGVSVKNVPVNLFHKIVGPEDYAVKALKNFDYKQEKLKFQRKFLSKF